MDELPSLNSLIKPIIFALIIIVIALFTAILNTETKIVFCNVGQGDATYLRINNKVDVLIDAGPDNKVLNCLGKYMPFFDRTIELAILSHPDSDHTAGLIPIIERYRLKTLILPPFEKNTNQYKLIKKKALSLNIKTLVGTKGQSFNIGQDTITIISPNNNNECSLANECSLIILFQQDYFKALFTGDASIKELLSLSKQSIEKTTILKIPHHGSKYGMTSNFIKLADPRVSVISVGKNNSYGHPAKVTLDILKASKTNIRRTDKEGDIVFKIK